MKKLISVLSLLLLFTVGANAQNRAIEFEESKNLTEIYQKAIEANKLVFIDCYTDWCGPCKYLAANIFTLDEVADYFNENFINANFEMEQDEAGIENAQKWGVAAFPTMIFVDPNTGDVLHRIVGVRPGEELIEAGEIALDPTRNLAGQIAIYEGGNREPEFISTLLKNFSVANMKNEINEVMADYFRAMTVADMATETNWELITEYEKNPLSDVQKKIMANRQPFYDVVGQEAVDNFLSGSIYNSISGSVFAFPSKGVPLKSEKVEEIKSYIGEIDLPEVKKLSAPFFETYKLFEAEDWEGMFDKIVEVNKSGILPSDQSISRSYTSTFLIMTVESQDNDLAHKAADYAGTLINNAGDNFDAKTQLAYTQYQIYNLIEDKEKAEESMNKFSEYREQLHAQREAAEAEAEE